MTTTRLEVLAKSGPTLLLTERLAPLSAGEAVRGVGGADGEATEVLGHMAVGWPDAEDPEGGVSATGGARAPSKGHINVVVALSSQKSFLL